MLKRDIYIDVVRGVAILLMIASHTAWFLNNGDTAWDFLRIIGDSLAYIVFLFLFGFTTYTFLTKDENYAPGIKSFLKREAILLVAYYSIAFVSIFKDLYEVFSVK